MIKPPALGPVPGGNTPTQGGAVAVGRVQLAEGRHREQAGPSQFPGEVCAGETCHVLKRGVCPAVGRERRRIVREGIARITVLLIGVAK